MKKQTRSRKTPVHTKIADVPVPSETYSFQEQTDEKKTRLSPLKIAISAGILLLVLVGGFMKRNRDQMVNLKTKTIPEAIQKITGGNMKVKTIDKVEEKSGVVSFDIVFDSQGAEQRYTSYITKDGKILFTAGTILSDVKESAGGAAQGEAKKLSCEDVKKADSTKITAFVVSQCPYGLQMQRVIAKAIAEQPLLADYLDIKYIGSVENGKITAMHGDEEAQENLKQICIREEQKDLYWPYVSCYMKAGKSDECITSSGVNVAQLTSCMETPSKGLAYAQKDFDIATKYNITASPTMLGNEGQIVSESDFGGRVADAMRQLVCCSSKTQQTFCKTELSKESVAASFSETEAGTGSNAAANCN